LSRTPMRWSLGNISSRNPPRLRTTPTGLCNQASKAGNSGLRNGVTRHFASQKYHADDWVKTGNVLIEQKISALTPKADIYALMSTRPSKQAV
jgi:hypothetical protein